MSYTTDDFSESFRQVKLDPTEVAQVIAAWGHGSGMGTDAGHFRWDENGASDWSGGFLMLLKDGSFAYLTGWCDYTGWGCQDGAELTRYETRPRFEDLTPEPEPDEWDIEPADLNRWLALEAK